MITTLIQTGPQRRDGRRSTSRSPISSWRTSSTYDEAFEKALDKDGFKALVEKRRGGGQSSPPGR